MSDTMHLHGKRWWRSVTNDREMVSSLNIQLQYTRDATLWYFMFTESLAQDLITRGIPDWSLMVDHGRCLK